jgi:hypothetical protein
MLTFQGTETLSIECEGSLSLAHARQLVPASLELQLHEGKAVLGLLYFQMHKLSASGLSWLPARLTPSFSYEELLWRIGVIINNQPVWYGLCCELNDRAVQKSAELMFQYTTEFASFTQQPEHKILISGRSTTTIQASPNLSIEAPTPRRLLVAKQGQLYEVSWNEKPAISAQRAQITVQTNRSLCGLSWRPEGVLLRGRTHICGVAQKYR